MPPGLEKENEAAIPMTNEIPTAPETLHKKPMQRKMPPHMRRLNMRFSSPSDNLSPMSQKLMLADRTNAAMKTVRPKSLKEILLCSREASLMPLSQSGTASETEDMLDACAEEIGSRLPDPPSPSKAHHELGNEMDNL